MRYIISGNRKSVPDYLAKEPLNNGEKIMYCSKSLDFSDIGSGDSIVLLKGWWGKKWAVNMINEIKLNFPKIDIKFFDGDFGQEFRKDNIDQNKKTSQFDLLIFED